MHKASHVQFAWLNFVGSFEQGKWSYKSGKNAADVFETDAKVTTKYVCGAMNRP
jgi:hypothetical protein